MPAVSAPQGWVLGGGLALTGLAYFPIAIMVSPLLAFAPLTNILFLVNLKRLWSSRPSTAPSVFAVGGALLFNGFALIVASTTALLGDMGRFPAIWFWLLSFVFLGMAIMRSEQSGASDRLCKSRWTLALALSCMLSIAGWSARTLQFPGPVIHRSVSGVEGVEIRRSGVAPGQQPLLEDGYLRRSKYQFFVVDGRTYESMPDGGWIARAGTSPVRHVIHEAVESYASRPGGSGAARRSIIKVYDGSELIAQKMLYDGMRENGNGWEGEIALKFVQTVLQPASRPSCGTGGCTR